MGGGGGGVKQDQAQAARFAGVARDLWYDRVQRFWPLEDQLLRESQMEEPAARRFVGQTMEATGQAFGGQREAMGRGLGRAGLALTAPQAEASGRVLAMGEEGAKVNLANAARLAVKEQTLGTLTGGLSAARLPDLSKAQ